MKRVIKRYENRKLYDTTIRRYVSLEDIAQLIRDGEEISVIEKSTGDDITTQTLTQVILDEGRRGKSLLSEETLHHAIRWGTSVLDEGLKQVREGVDHLLPESLGNLFKSNGRRGSKAQADDEMGDLKKRIEHLESLIQQLNSRAGEHQSEDQKDQK